jgi:hypothetical protein
MRQKFHTTLKLGSFAIVLALVAGCENPHLMQLKDEFGWTEAKMVSDGWLKSRVIAQPPVYCYRTLADADCFSTPKHEHQDRLTASPYQGVF